MMEFEDEHDDEDQQDREEHEVIDQDDDDEEEDDDGDEIQLHQNQSQQHHFNNNNNNLTHQQLPYKFEIKKHNPQLNQQQLSSASVARYRECLKNHAVNIGGHAVDGCGEFMPAGPDGTLDALKCAACNCHRNFHRKELLIDTTNNNHQLTIFSPRPHHAYHPPPPPPHQVFQFYPTGRGAGPTSSFATPPQVRPLALPPAGGGSGDTEENMIGGMATMTVTSSGKKRFRTKFTPEQKEKMFGFAERVGWRIQKQDEGLVQEFCNESGVKRHVLKVWMHNNKHTLGKKTLV